ncbi:MAG: translation elongation factor-like protein [bacterium]|nr:translation elongation factor-like protein [bacterium]
MFKNIFSFGKNKESKVKSKPIGEVTHYFGDLSVAVIKFNQFFKAGDKVHFKGATTDFEQTIKSIQCDHQVIADVKKGQEVGVKVKNKVRQGDQVYPV